jgi:hypothetical protein
MVVGPYRESRYVARGVERGVCPWCHAEIEYVAGDACPACDAQISPQQARELLELRAGPSPVSSARWPRSFDIVCACVLGIALAIALAAYELAIWLPASARL